MDETVFWYEKAAAQGFPCVAYRLGRIFRENSVPPAVVEVLQEYKKTVDFRWMFPSPVKENRPSPPV